MLAPPPPRPPYWQSVSGLPRAGAALGRRGRLVVLRNLCGGILEERRVGCRYMLYVEDVGVGGGVS